MNKQLCDLGYATVRYSVTGYTVTLEITTPADCEESSGFSPAQTVGIYGNDPIWKLRDLLNTMYEEHLKLKHSPIIPYTK